MERAARLVSEQMSAKIKALGQGLSEGEIKYEGWLLFEPVLMLLLSTADAGDYTDDSNKDNEAVLP